MKIEYDREVDALYVRLYEKYVARTIEIEEGMNIDLDENGKLIGLEVLDATERYSLTDIFNVATENLILEKEISPWKNLEIAVSQIPTWNRQEIIGREIYLRYAYGKLWPFSLELWACHWTNDLMT